MGGLSFTHWMIVALIVLILFGGKNKISSLMGDIGKGFKELRSGLSDAEDVKRELDKPLPKSD